MRKREKALKFVEHIERHLKQLDEDEEVEAKGYNLPQHRVVACKICNKTIDEIAEEKVEESR